jgi:hypothetical protein
MIISVHLPKTAGSSFQISLDQHFAKKLLLDYTDLPINTPPFERNRRALISGVRNTEMIFSGIECIHGHFMPVKYLLLNTIHPLTFVTWMRNPVERVISHFYFWEKTYCSNSPPLHKRIIEEKWTLEKFCLSDEVRNLYHQFLWGFPLHNFDFIGITEHYEYDFMYFSHFFLHQNLTAHKVNINKNRKGDYPISKTLRRQIESFHMLDMELYHIALKLRFQRKEKLLSKIIGIFQNK